MEKDLLQAKRLASVLEARASELVTYKPVFPVGAPLSAEPPSVDDFPMTDEGSGGFKEEELDAARGSKAVEERIDKIASETLDTDENGNPDREKYVSIALYSSGFLRRFLVPRSLSRWICIFPIYARPSIAAITVQW
jgi:hypothetical protein